MFWGREDGLGLLVLDRAVLLEYCTRIATNDDVLRFSWYRIFYQPCDECLDRFEVSRVADQVNNDIALLYTPYHVYVHRTNTRYQAYAMFLFFRVDS